ncbi:Exosome complex exonuclease rrp6-like protein [Globisporangium polare]
MAMDGAASKAFVDALYRKVLLSVKASNAIPSEDDDFHYHSKFSKAFAAHVTTSGAKLEELVWQLTNVDKDKKKSANADDADDEDEEDDDAKKRELFDGPEPKSAITDFVDTLLDEASKQLELFQRGPAAVAAASSGLRPLENKPLSFDKKDEKEKANITAANNNSVRHSRGLAKPQDQFDEQIDNSDAPFASKLREKAHALHNAPVAMEDDDMEDSLQLQHPYYPEIKALKFAEWQLEASTDAYKKIPVEDASFLWVNSDETLAEMMKTLSKPENRVIAVDLEHHSYRSYLGLVCLMQISTATEDFLVDTLALRSKLQTLNTVFCDPQRVKVLHGSDMDIFWLQRDLGLYIVNMFDTGQAARLLQYPRFSLAYLLKRHCAIDADKQYQLADWRIRPLDKNMVKYAREDTRYLLYIYDQMKHELLAQSDTTRSSLLFEALQNSSKICLQVYVKPEVSNDDCVALSEKLKGTVGIPMLSELQHRVFALLYFWRDRIARLEDESTAYVLPNHALMKITKQLPTKSDQLFRTCNPVPPLVRKYAHELTSQISAEKAKLAAEEAKAAASEGASAAVPVAKKSSTHWRAEQDEDVVMASSTFAVSASHMSEYAGWQSGKRKAKCVTLDDAEVSSGLRASFAGLSTVGGGDDGSGVTTDESVSEKLARVNQLVARTAFTVTENDRVECNVVSTTPLADAKAAQAAAATSEALPQSIAETYQMTNRAKRRKTQQAADEEGDDDGDDASGEIAVPSADRAAQPKKPQFKAFDYSAASEQIAGAKMNMADATKANDRQGGKKKRGVKQQGSGYNPFVAIRGAAGDAPQEEMLGAKKAVKKMHHMPRSATFR